MAKRTVTMAVALHAAAAIAAGAAHAAPAQPGLAAPDPGQPGLSTTPQPPAAQPAQPSMVDYLPPVESLPTPSRPRPQQQNPETQTLIQPNTQAQPTQAGSDAESAQSQATETDVPAVVGPVRPDTLRYGSASFTTPDWIDTSMATRLQQYSDLAEWWVADAYDRAGFSPEESDRRAAAALMGAGAGAYAGAVLATPIPAVLGCLGGGVAGALIGAGVAGLPTVGVGAPLGAAVGSVIGCAAGGVGVGLVGLTVGAAAGGVLGGAAAGALGGPTGLSQPQTPQPLVEVAPVQVVDPVTAVQSWTENTVTQVNAAAPQVESVIDQVAASSPQGEAVVTSLRDAIDQLPTFSPEQFGPLSSGLNDLTAAAAAAVGAA